ncbi:MAG TPA: cytochrome c3 family protein [Woeseiaceae bacterium]
MNNVRILIAVSCLCALLVPSVRDLRAEEAADQFDCAACHPMKIRDFAGRRANPVTPVEEFPELPSGKQDVASSPAMCFSCHDGFVMDSRLMWTDGYRGHRIGMPPPPDITIPELGGSPEFPLNSDGNIYCGTCHSGHRNEAEGAPEKVNLFMRQSADGGNICTACHTEKAEIKGSGHDKGGRRNKDFEARGTCGNCHLPHGSDRPLMWARDLGKDEQMVNRLCRSCHDEKPQPASHPGNVVAWSQEIRGAIFSNTPGEMPVFDENLHQARVGVIGCPTCHNVHRERAEGRPEHLKGLHLRLPEFVEPLCADCHGPEALFRYKFFHSEASR